MLQPPPSKADRCRWYKCYKKDLIKYWGMQKREQLASLLRRHSLVWKLGSQQTRKESDVSPWSKAVILNYVHQNRLEGLLHHRCWATFPRVSASADLGWRLSVCISGMETKHVSPEAADAAGQAHTVIATMCVEGNAISKAHVNTSGKTVGDESKYIRWADCKRHHSKGKGPWKA